MPLADDSYQYLNVADNVERSRGLATSLVHFDTERSHGRIPAQLTTFPPGYPLLVAAFPGDLERTARIVSVLSYAGTAACLAWALILTNVIWFVRITVLLLFFTNAVALRLATAVLSEPLYMLLSTGAVVMLISFEKVPSPVRVIIAFLLAGLAYWVRYAGLFLIAALVCYALLRWVRARRVLLLSCLIPILLSSALMLRNVLTVGTWKGGNAMPVHNPLKGVVADYVRVQMHLLIGQHPVTFGVWEALLLVGVLALIPLLRVHLSGRLPVLVGLCILVYSAGLFYAGLRTMISFTEPRMFLPILPLYLLLLAIGLNASSSRWLKPALAMLVVGYVGVNARDLYDPVSPARYKILAAEYAEPDSQGQPLSTWIDSHIPAGDAIIAADGQATGYLLKRPTVSMVGAHYSPVRWDCDEVKSQMKRFRARYVILYKPSSAGNDDPLLRESQFVATSVTQQPPCGFVIAAENPDVRILEFGRPQRTPQP